LFFNRTLFTQNVDK